MTNPFKINWLEYFDEALKGLEDKICQIWPIMDRFRRWLDKKLTPIRTALGFLFSFLAYINVYFYQHLKDAFVEFANKLQELSAMSSSNGDMTDMTAFGLLEKIEVANAAFPIDHLLNCCIFILSAWVVALQLKFVFFIIRLFKP